MTLDEWEQSLGRWATGLSASADQAAQTNEDLLAPGQAREETQRSNQSDTPWLDSIEQTAMACEFEVLLRHGQYVHGLEHARDAMRVVHALEDQLSVYRPTSDFSTINRWAHLRPVAARYDVIQLLEVAQEVSRSTSKAFDITAGALSEVWGFSRRQGRKPDDDELQAAIQCVGSELFVVDRNALTVKFERPGVKLNPGGIGKGYALDRMAQQLVDNDLHDFLIHGGRSSIAARGHRYQTCSRATTEGLSEQIQRDDSGSGWWIALAHPLRWEEKLGHIRLRDRALGTSGAGKQFFHYQGVRYSHVIDPRNGWPAQAALSATAICRSGALADALATAFMVMGSQGTAEFCAAHPSVGAILVSSPPGSSRLNIERFNWPDEDWQDARQL